MHSDYAQILILLSQKLALMHDLADALEQGQEPLAAMDLKLIQQSNLRQQGICDELAALTEPLSTEHRRLTATLSQNPPTAAEASAAGVLSKLREQHPDLFAECAAMEKRVRQLNLVHAALLRRTRQTFAVLNNLMSAGALTYAQPGSSRSVEGACATRE
jgi:hypothetical protein